MVTHKTTVLFCRVNEARTASQEPKGHLDQTAVPEITDPRVLRASPVFQVQTGTKDLLDHLGQMASRVTVVHQDNQAHPERGVSKPLPFAAAARCCCGLRS